MHALALAVEFNNKFCKTLFSRYGCVSFKTGRHNDGQASIGQCFDVLKSNSPVFLLDCFERPDVVEWKDAKSHHAKQPRVVRLSRRRLSLASLFLSYLSHRIFAEL